MTSQDLQIEHRGNVAVVRLHRGAKRNALSDGLILALRDAFQNLPEGIRAAVLDGEGDHFCAGLDLSELQERDDRLKALNNVPPEHQPLVADAREYLRLRHDAWRTKAIAIRRSYASPKRAAVATEPAADARWRMQAEARHRANQSALGNAESAERASLEAFRKINP